MIAIGRLPAVRSAIAGEDFLGILTQQFLEFLHGHFLYNFWR